jgi:K+-transporting ATPase ATPase C chain
MKKNLMISVWMTIATTILLGIVYPLVVTGLAQVFFKDKANGQLIVQNGKVVGSRIIGQAFTGPAYFHANSSPSNLGPTNQHLIDRVKSDVATNLLDHPQQSVPVDLVTMSGSGLDPHISPAAAEFQVDRVARERGIKLDDLRQLVRKHTEGRQMGFLGEARVNVLELNLELDERFPLKKQAKGNL